jgi:hypothetical protein
MDIQEYAKDMEDMTSEKATKLVLELQAKYAAVFKDILKLEEEKDVIQKEIELLQDNYVILYEE